MSFLIAYLSTGIMDTAFDSQVLPVLAAARNSGMNLLHVSIDPFCRETTEAYVQKKKQLGSLGMRAVYLRQAPPVSRWFSEIDARRISRSLTSLEGTKAKTVLHCRGHLNAYRGLVLKRKNPKVIRVVADLRGAIGDEANFFSSGLARRVLAPRLGRLYRKMEEEILRESDHILCVSEAFKTHLQANGPIQNLTVMPTFVDTSRFRFSRQLRDSCRERLGLSDRIVLVYSGGTARWQHLDAVVRLFTGLKRQVKPLFMLFLSHNVSRLKEIIGDRIHPSEVKVIQVPHREVAEYLFAADIGVLLRDDRLTNRVASPIKFSEYMCCGLPCILSENIGDTAEVVRSGRAGMVLPSERTVPTVSEIERLLSLDREGISRSMAGRYSSDLHLPRILDLYRALGEEAQEKS